MRFLYVVPEGFWSFSFCGRSVFREEGCRCASSGGGAAGAVPFVCLPDRSVYRRGAGGAVRGGSAFCGVGRRRFRCGKMVVAEREERCGARVSAGYSGEEFTCFTKSGYG